MSDLFETPNTTTASNDYSATSIEVLEGLEPVRHRPGMYIGGTDETALHHLVAEILDNSMDEAVAGYANKIEVQMNADYSVTITDTGRGIPEEFQRSIFQPFFRVDKSRSREYGGVGLGLSLVWEIADLHGGCVRVEESSDEGTTIAVELPVQ